MAKILITDDSDTIREIMREMLTEAGHTIVGEAVDGNQAFELYKELQPDITTLDISMPIMCGMEALEKIIEIDPAAKILMVSSVSTGGSIPKAFITGACDFIQKPFEKEKLLDVIARIESSLVS